VLDLGAGLGGLVAVAGAYLVAFSAAGLAGLLVYSWMKMQESNFALEAGCLVSILLFTALELGLGLYNHLVILCWVLIHLPLLFWCAFGPLGMDGEPVLLEPRPWEEELVVELQGSGRLLSLSCLELRPRHEGGQAGRDGRYSSGASGRLEAGPLHALLALDRESRGSGGRISFAYEVDVSGGEAYARLWIAATGPNMEGDEGILACRGMCRRAASVAQEALLSWGLAVRRIVGEELVKVYLGGPCQEGLGELIRGGSRLVASLGAGRYGALLHFKGLEGATWQGSEEIGNGGGRLVERLLQSLHSLEAAGNTGEGLGEGVFPDHFSSPTISFRLIVCFWAGREPKLNLGMEEALAARQPDFRLPRRLEDHLFREALDTEEVVERCRATGCFNCSCHLLVEASTPDLAERGVEAGWAALQGVWPGLDVEEQTKHLSSRQLIHGFQTRRIMSHRGEVVSGATLLSLIQLPIPVPGLPLERDAPIFPLPTHRTGEMGRGILLGWAIWMNRPAQPVRTTLDDLALHTLIIGESGFGKTRLVANTLGQTASRGSNFLLFDLKGEYAGLLRRLGVKFRRLVPGVQGPNGLRMNLFDPRGATADEHALRLVSLFQDNLRQALGEELSPLGVRLLREALTATISAGPGQWNFVRLFAEIDRCAAKLRRTIREVGQSAEALKNRLLPFAHLPLGLALASPVEGSLPPEEFLWENTVVDLSVMLRSGCSRAHLRLLLNLILDRILRHHLHRQEQNLKGLIVVEEANVLLGQGQTSPGRQIAHGSLADFVLLARSAGLGLVLVAQRPVGIPEEVLANAGTRIAFRSPFDSRQLARYLNLNQEQEEYLRVLPRRQAVALLPRLGQPVLIQTPHTPDPEPEREPQEPEPAERVDPAQLATEGTEESCFRYPMRGPSSSPCSSCSSPAPLGESGPASGPDDVDGGGAGRLARVLMADPGLVSCLEELTSGGAGGRERDGDTGKLKLLKLLAGLGLAKRAGGGFKATRLGKRVLKTIHSLRNLDITVDGWEGSAPASGAGPHPGAALGADGGEGK